MSIHNYYSPLYIVPVVQYGYSRPVELLPARNLRMSIHNYYSPLYIVPVVQYGYSRPVELLPARNLRMCIHNYYSPLQKIAKNNSNSTIIILRS